KIARGRVCVRGRVRGRVRVRACVAACVRVGACMRLRVKNEIPFFLLKGPSISRHIPIHQKYFQFIFPTREKMFSSQNLPPPSSSRNSFCYSHPTRPYPSPV